MWDGITGSELDGCRDGETDPRGVARISSRSEGRKVKRVVNKLRRR